MGIKKYLVLGFMYIAIISGVVVSLGISSYKLVMFGYYQEFPIVVWVVLPTVVLFLFTIVHLAYYWAKAMIDAKALKNDEAKIIQLIKHKLSGSTIDTKPTNKHMKNITNVLTKLNITNDKAQADTSNETIDKLIIALDNIQKHKYENLKEFNLNSDAKVVIQNNLNKILQNDSYANTIIKKPQNHNTENIKTAFMQLLQNNQIGQIKLSLKEIKLDVDMLLALMTTNSSESKELVFDNQQIINMTEDMALSSKQYKQIARIYLNKMAPEQLSALFEKFFTIDENSSEAYLLVLFELGMTDDIRDILSNSKKDEYIKFKALMQLKEAGKYYTYDNLFS
jgi:uncharacterized membrane protein